MSRLKELRKEKGILVAAHRGTSGGNIPPNTIASFDITHLNNVEKLHWH